MVSTEEIISMRNLYEQNMRECYSNQSFTGPWTRKWIKDIKKMLKSNSNLPLSQLSLYKKYVENKYNLLGNKHAGQLVRVLKTPGEDLSIPVMPWEDAFDVIWQAHVESGHGDVTETMNILKTKYFIEVGCVYCVVTLCCLCNKNLDSNHSKIEPIYNKRASLEIIDMTVMPDVCYKYLLIYTDEGTGLVQLRAFAELTNIDLAFELIKIFTDLGPPKILRVFNPAVYYDSVIDVVNRIFQPCLITLETCIQSDSKAKEIKKMILEWMKEEKTVHWEMGCYALQSKINNTVTKGKSPYKCVFEHANIKKSSNYGINNKSDCIDNRTDGCGPSQTIVLPTAYLQQNINVNLFDEPDNPSDMYPIPKINITYPQPMSINVINHSITNEDPVTEDNIHNDALNVTKIDFTCPGAKQKSYVNKKILNRDQNVLTEYVKSNCGPRGTVIKTEPDDSITIEDSCVSSNVISDNTMDDL